MTRLLLAAALAALLLLLPRPVATVHAQSTAPEAPTIDTVTAGDTTLTIAWTAPANNGGETITAYDLRYIRSEAIDPSDDDWTLVETIWSSGTLEYELTGLDRDTSYDLQVRAVNAIDDGAWSESVSGATTDHGNTRETATSITLNSAMPGSIEPLGDEDYFSITLSEATEFWAYTVSELDTVGELLDSDGEPIATHDNSHRSSGTRNFALHQSLEAGTYYLKVTTYRDLSGGAYTLHTAEGITPGQSFATATTVTLGSPVFTRLAANRHNHYYRIEVPALSVVWIRSALSIDVRMSLYDGARREIGNSDDIGFVGNPTAFSLLAWLNPATYYLRIRSFAFASSGPYILEVDSRPTPGSTPETAQVVELNSLHTGRVMSTTDRNYFRFSIDRSIWTLLYGIPQGSGSLTMRLLDGDLNEVALTGESTRDASRFFSLPPLPAFRHIVLLPAGTYYVEVTGTENVDKRYVLHVLPSPDDQDPLDLCLPIEHMQSDALYGCQWHLSNTGQFDGAEEDINVEEVWESTKGAGVNVAVVDDGLQVDHPDLTDNVVTSRNHSYVEGGVYHVDRTHGTAVAGLIAARDNDLGVRGVAPRASIYAYNLLAADESADREADAMTRNLADTVVSNNSWGPFDDGSPETSTSAWQEAVERGVTEGNAGKGISYVWAAGNGHQENDYSNLDGYANFYAVTAVCAVNHEDTRASYSERGANLWVCAPSINGDGRLPGIATTSTHDRYRADFGGTSAAAPIVSGVIALVRATNPDLTWRDVKLILAASARQNDASHAGWETGALRYGDNPDMERYSFNHDYGFGVVDAGAAVALAADWDLLPSFREQTVLWDGSTLAIPDLPDDGDPVTVTSSLDGDEFVDFIEFVEVHANIEHASFRDLEIELVSPSGAVSTLSTVGPVYSYFFGHRLLDRISVTGTFRYGSARHLGEDPAGEWTLRITDHADGHSGTLKGWALTVYGHGSSAGAPTLESIAGGDRSLTVTWAAPELTSTSAVTSYDLRHLRDDAPDSLAASWTEVTGIWTSGELSHEVTGLAGGRTYDVQVRAVNDHGPGPWSNTLQAATDPVRPDPPVISDIRVRNGSLDVRWDEPAFTGGAAITSYDLRSIRTDATERGDDQWALVENAGTLDGESYTHRIADLTNDVSYDVQVRAHNSEGASDWSASASEAPELNLDPAFPASETGVRQVSEAAAHGTRFGDPVTATDPNNQVLRYSITSAGGLFGIDSATAELLLLGDLDYETTPSHTVTVSASDLQNMDGDHDSAVDASIEVTVMVEDFNEGVEVTGPEEAKPLEGENEILATFVGVDPEGDTITWSLEGDDAGVFSLNSRVQLRFLQPPDFEAPLDSDKDNAYLIRVVASDGVNSSPALLTVTVRDRYEPPVITGAAHVTINEVITDQGGSVGVDRYFTETVEGTRLRWRPISGADASRFAFDRGALSFREAPDFEARADANGDNVYEVTLSSTDFPDDHPSLTYAFFDVEVTVRNVNEAPVISGPAGPFTVRENGPLAVASFSASDPDENDDVSLELGGLDAAAFTLDDGRLAFASAPDYEAPADSDGDNAYELTLSTSDGEETASLDLVVRVTNEDEAGALTLSSPQPRIGVLLEATLSEPDDVSAESWTWERSSNRSSWSVISGAGGSAYTPAVADRDHYLRVTVRYSDAFGQKSLRSASTNPTRPDPGNNTAPFFATPPPDLTVAEQTPPGRAVGSPVEGADNENDPLTYTLSVSPGGRPSFVIGRFTGQVRVAPDAVLDHEDSDAYGATVTIADSFNVRASASFTITVTDVDEPPLAEDDSGATFEDTAALVDVLFNDRDPEGEPLSISIDAGQQLSGTVTVTAGNLISYLPDPDTHGIQRFRYRVSDGTHPRTATAEVTVRVEPVNDNPEFSAATAAREVDELAAPGDPVGDPVVATDVDGDSITYSLTGSDLFTVEPHNGQIMLAEDVLLDARETPEHVVTVLADDGKSGVDTIEVTITVLEAVVEVPSRALPVFVPGGGGGGGGGPSGPTPSTVDFEWTVKHDLQALDAANESPTGMWSDGVIMWLANNADGPGDAVYAYGLATGERVEEREFDLDAANRAPRGLWSDGETVWVADSGRDRLFAYDLATGERLQERDLELAAANDDARGLWSDGERLWVLDDRDDALYAYDLATGELLGGFALDSRNASPRGLWSDGVSLWVSDPGASPRRLFAYRLPTIGEEGVPEDAALSRVDEEDFAELSGASNNSPRGIWSDGELVYVADASDGKVYTYNMPDAIDARLASLALSGVDIGDFDPGRTEYEGAIAGGVTETTVTAEAVQRRTSVTIAPEDAGGEAEGHQVALEGLAEVTVTVTSADGTRTKVYRVGFEQPTPALVLAPGWNSLRWTGADGAPIAEALAAAGDVLAVYAWDAASGAWLAHLPGLEHLPGANTLSAFSSGQTYWIALDDAPASEVAAAAGRGP